MQTPTLIRPLSAAILCSLALAACGADDPTGEPASADDRQSQNREAILAHAQCMRDHGVDMPDPQFDGGRVMQRGPSENVPDATMRKAEEACEKHLEGIEPPELSDEDRERFRKAALEHAQCMRDHGIENFPDPTFGEGGRVEMRIDRSSGIDPESPKFQEAQEACEGTLPEPREETQ